MSMMKWVCLLVGCSAVACQAPEDDAVDEPTPQPSGSPSSSEEQPSDPAAQRLGNNLFHAVFSTLQFNVQMQAGELAATAGEERAACLGWAGSPMTEYGEASYRFAAGGDARVSYRAEVGLDGCVALDSGDHPDFVFETQDLSGDDVSETYILHGRLAAVSFDDEGVAPAPDLYDANAEPTCSEVFVDRLRLETPGFDATGQVFSNEESSHHPDGYSAGTLHALCGGRKLHCELAGATSPVGLINLDAVAAAQGRSTNCRFDD